MQGAEIGEHWKDNSEKYTIEEMSSDVFPSAVYSYQMLQHRLSTVLFCEVFLLGGRNLFCSLQLILEAK